MHPHDASDDRPRFHWQPVASVPATFIAAFLVPYRFLVHTAHHKVTHLERTRSTPLSYDSVWWEAGDARLDAAQNHEVDRMCILIRKIGEQVIVPLVRSVEAEEQGRRLVRFDCRFKDTNRLKHKVASQLRLAPARTPTEVLAVMHDTVRFTLQYLETDYVAGVRKDMARFRRRGFILVSLRNTWTDDQYKAINARWREPTSGLLFEIQFHTQASLTARELTHKTYERIRGDTVEGTEMAILQACQRQVNAMVPIPPGAEKIGNDYDEWKEISSSRVIE